MKTYLSHGQLPERLCHVVDSIVVSQVVNAWWQFCCFGSRTLQQSQIEPSEHQDNSDVYYQPLQDLVPEEEDVHADNDRYQREHVKNNGGVAL